MRPLLILFFALVFDVQGFCQALGPGPRPPVEAPTLRHTTEHYALQLQGSDEEAAELGAMLEQTWPTFRAFFQAEPPLAKGERLTFELYGSRAAWQAGTLAHGIGPPAAADRAWFSSKTRAVYAYRGEIEYVTRAHAIYGACLQFHALAKPKNLELAAAWYVHGIAEMFAIHTWDQGRLELSVSRRVCVLDPAARALEALGRVRRPWSEANLQQTGVRWAAVRFARDAFAGKYRTKFDKLALGMTGSMMSGEDFRRSLGREQEIEAEFYGWLASIQTPFEVGALSFEELADGRFVGSPGRSGFALCCLKKPARFLEATIANGRDQRGSPGLVLAWKKPADSTIARFSEPMLFVEEHVDGELVRTEPIPLAREGLGKIRVRAERTGDGVRVLADGRVLYTAPIRDPVFGLCASWSNVTFEEVKWE